MPKAPERSPLTLAGPAGDLEALLELPADIAVPARIAVLCHPHPLHQGTMQNKVVHTLARAMNDLGAGALRFNFRGVGSSAGSYAEGEGELADALAVIAYVRERWPEAALWLAGFSFGGVIAARAAAVAAPAALVTVAPAVNILGERLEQLPTMPWLIVQGDADDVVPAADVLRWQQSWSAQREDGGPELLMLADTGHFFHGQLPRLRQGVTQFLSQT